MHDLGGFPGNQDSGQQYHWTLMKEFAAIVEGSQRRTVESRILTSDDLGGFPGHQDLRTPVISFRCYRDFLRCP